MLVTYLATCISLLLGVLALLAWLMQHRGRKAEAARAKQWSDFVAKTATSNSLLAQPPLAAACAEAGLRAAECLLSSEPLLRDPVAPMLCGTYGLSYGKLFTQLMQEQEGWGKKPNTVARARILDDDLSFLLAAVAKEDPDADVVQIVCLECGMDTRPWRLRRGRSGRGAAGPKVVWFDVDQRRVIELKKKMLRDGGVELQQPSAAAAASTPAGSKQPMKRQPPPILLAVDELHCIGCDLSAGGGVLAAALQEAGFSSSAPTIWVTEGGLLSRQELGRTTALLRECSRLSPPGSRLLATVTSRACLQAHPSFCQHCAEDLLAPGVMDGLGWERAYLSGDVAEVSRSRYRVECFPFFARFASPPEVASLVDVEHVLTATRS